MTLREKVKAAIWDVMDRRFSDAYQSDADEATDAVMEILEPIKAGLAAAAGHWRPTRMRQGDEGLCWSCPGCNMIRITGEEIGDAEHERHCAYMALKRALALFDGEATNHLTDAEEAEARRLYRKLCDDVASGDTWGLGETPGGGEG